MARLTKYALFMRVFLTTLIAGGAGTAVRSDPQDDADWSATVQLGTADAYYWYLRRNPTGAHIESAIAALRQLGELGGSGAEPRVRAVELY